MNLLVIGINVTNTDSFKIYFITRLVLDFFCGIQNIKNHNLQFKANCIDFRVLVSAADVIHC